ncbi:unnamed protein product [Acanthoscelides obtectus]|uniref:Uncharacterized protein n=1 Tax=Acanthoscelides obtectus TaxID=200917 RepID=A0A9P0KZD0_ACAOB|nr:unnamed protein product [Acanthoscelides obtectus]CAK1644004.1 hypothetical protein AOBTE_LOCUS13772 [Acanthoscelides obtectus]
MADETEEEHDLEGELEEEEQATEADEIDTKGAIDAESEETEPSSESEKSTKSIGNTLSDIFYHRYFRDIVKSTIVFVIALKMAQECKHMRIPIKEYQPFHRL